MDVASTASVSAQYDVEGKGLGCLDLEGVKERSYARKKVGEVSRIKRIVNGCDT